MKTYENEEGYVQLLRDAISVSATTPDRTGCGTQKQFGAVLEFKSISEGFPLFTGRATATPLQNPFIELMFFLRGRVQTKELEALGCNFWQVHTSRTYLDSRGLNFLPEGHMGFAYGSVMRHAGGDWDENYNPVGGFDQLAYVVQSLKDDIWTRRAMIELWAPQDLHRMALTPCCHNYQFCAVMGPDGAPVLNLAIKIRSSDLPFGLPANAAQFGILLLAMAKLLKVQAGSLTLNIVDAHIYSSGYANQIPYMTEAVEREIFPLPQVSLSRDIDTLDDLLSLTLDDVQIHNYKRNTLRMKTPRPPVAI